MAVSVAAPVSFFLSVLSCHPPEHVGLDPHVVVVLLVAVVGVFVVFSLLFLPFHSFAPRLFSSTRPVSSFLQAVAASSPVAAAHRGAATSTEYSSFSSTLL